MTAYLLSIGFFQRDFEDEWPDDADIDRTLMRKRLFEGRNAERREVFCNESITQPFRISLNEKRPPESGASFCAPDDYFA